MLTEQLNTYLDAFLLWSLLKNYNSRQLDHQQPWPASSRSEIQISGSCNISVAIWQGLFQDIHQGCCIELQFCSDQQEAASRPGLNLTTFLIGQPPHYTHHKYPPHLNNETSTGLDLSVGTLVATNIVCMSSELTHKLLLECMKLDKFTTQMEKNFPFRLILLHLAMQLQTMLSFSTEIVPSI